MGVGGAAVRTHRLAVQPTGGAAQLWGAACRGVAAACPPQLRPGIGRVASTGIAPGAPRGAAPLYLVPPLLLQVRDLVYKRGYAKINGQRVPITDNSIVEEQLSEKTKGAVICVEDLVNQIYTAGPFFKECTKFLWAFKMNNPVGGFSRIRHHFVEGGDAGNREEYVNELIRRMN